MVQIIEKYSLDFLSEEHLGLCKFQFIAFIYSSWHFDNLVSCMDLYEVSKGVIILMPTGVNRFPDYYFSDLRIKDCIVYKLTTDASDYDLSIFKRIFMKKNRKRIIVFNPMAVNIRTFSKLPVGNLTVDYIIIDEGLGTYTFPLKRKTLKEGMKQILKKLMIVFIDINLKYQVLFYDNKRKLGLNVRLSNALNRHYKSISELSGLLSSEEYQYVPNSVLFFKDYVVQDNEFYDQLLSKLTSFNLNVCVKLHPCEKSLDFLELANKYGCHIVPSYLSGEQVVYLRPTCVISGFSTAGYTSAGIFNIPVFNLWELYKDRNILLDRYQEVKLFNDCIFRSLPNIKFVNSLDEIRI